MDARTAQVAQHARIIFGRTATAGFDPHWGYYVSPNGGVTSYYSGFSIEEALEVAIHEGLGENDGPRRGIQ